MSLTDLITRVAEATGPDREIDADIAIHFGLVDAREVRGVPTVYMSGKMVAEVSMRVPRLTASIDAVVALIRREMPGARWLLESDEGGGFAIFRKPVRTDSGPVSRPDALALLLAFLRAVQARQTEDATT